jgi:hypothetical protein
MKKIKLLFVITLVLFAASSFSQEKDKEVMIKKIFKILQQKDDKGFVHLFPDAVTTKEFASKLIGVDSTYEGSEEFNNMMEMLTDSILQERYREMFIEIIEDGEKKGVEWAKTNFVSYTADSSIQEETKMPQLEGKIYFNIDKMEYFLKYNDIIWFENHGWYGVTFDRIDEKSKENEPEEFDLGVADSAAMIMDTAMMMVDTAIAAPVEKPAIKPIKSNTEPVKNKSIKPKTQAPARKPD